VASASSIADEDLANLAKELATPKRKNKNVFRSVKLGTPTNFRRSETPREEPETPKSEDLRRIDTAKTDGSAEDFLFGSNVAEVMNTEDTGSRGIRRRIPSPVQIENAYDIGSLDLSSEAREVQPFLRRHTSMAIVYLSVFSSFGSIIRIFAGRLFGLDCEFQSTQDWLSPFSQQICITSSGMSTQRGGALFTDLPANMLGSFIIGVLTVLEPSWPALPWLEADHPLQEHEILHVAIKVGMCGSLTTFSSWNSQMVAMMDGSQSELGSQVAAALFGYMVGTMGAVASFLFGTHVSTWLNHWRNPNTKHPFTESVHDDLGIEGNFKNDVENPSPPLLVVQYPERTATRRALKTFAKSASTFIGTRLPFIIFGVLFASFLVGDFLYGIPFYRFLWLEVIVTPPAALLRWFLALRLNDAAIGRGRSMGWLPQGTLCANILGSVVSILMLALEYRRSANGASGTGWRAAILSAIRVGGAGSLSTVSTFAKELVDIAQHFPHQAKAYYYGLVSIASALVFSLIIYIPIVRHS
jgi:fluoride ion exporter CrcB/FEX